MLLEHVSQVVRILFRFLQGSFHVPFPQNQQGATQKFTASNFSCNRHFLTGEGRCVLFERSVSHRQPFPLALSETEMLILKTGTSVQVALALEGAIDEISTAEHHAIAEIADFVAQHLGNGHGPFGLLDFLDLFRGKSFSAGLTGFGGAISRPSL